MAADLPCHVALRAQLCMIESGDADVSPVLVEPLLAELAQLIEPERAVALANERLERGNDGLPLLDVRLPAPLRVVLRQDGSRQQEVLVGNEPPITSVRLPKEGAVVDVARLTDEAEGLLPVVVSELQDSLPREVERQVLLDLRLGDRHAA